MPGLLKVGFTNRDVKERVGELSSVTGVPKVFQIEYYCLTRDVEEIEAEVHKHLSSKWEQGKEFFAAPLVEVVELIDSLIRQPKADRFSSVPKAHPRTDDLICPSCGTNNRGTPATGLDAEITCKKCGYLVQWGGGTKRKY